MSEEYDPLEKWHDSPPPDPQLGERIREGLPDQTTRPGDGNVYDPLFGDRIRFLLFTTPRRRFIGLIVLGIVFGLAMDLLKVRQDPPKPEGPNAEQLQKLRELELSRRLTEPQPNDAREERQRLEAILKRDPPADPRARLKIEQRIETLRKRELRSKEHPARKE